MTGFSTLTLLLFLGLALCVSSKPTTTTAPTTTSTTSIPEEIADDAATSTTPIPGETADDAATSTTPIPGETADDAATSTTPIPGETADDAATSTTPIPGETANDAATTLTSGSDTKSGTTTKPNPEDNSIKSKKAQTASKKSPINNSGQCICTMKYAPVCGTDGNTYSNACSLSCEVQKTGQKISVASKGECP